jgi:predicted DNA-binding transcriptional regulator AlpA
MGLQHGALTPIGNGLSSQRLLTAEEVAAYLQVSKYWVLDHAAGRRRPYLPSIKLGRKVRFEACAVYLFVEDCRRMASEFRKKGRTA